MRMTTMIALASLLAVSAAGAQSKPTAPATDGPKLIDTLTVEEALNVGGGLQQLVAIETSEKDGKTTKTYYKFSGNTRIDIAVDIEASRRVQNYLQDARNAIIMQLSDGTGKVSDEKRPMLDLEVVKLMQAKARAEFIKIKQSDLRLDENDIPGPVLSLFLPIIER